MQPVDRDRFLEEGYLVVKEAIPREKLQGVRRAYETLANQQREHWRAMRNEGDPPGGEWETSPQPRLMLQRPPLVHGINEETAPAVEVWLEPDIRGISSRLLGVADAAVTEMMMMCSPVRDHGPAKWHRDHHPIDTAPLQGYIDDILEGGPRYVQWNIPLYDDNVLWVVPGSHVRLNTKEENELLLADPCQPLPNGVQTHLEAGDGVVYILPILHWGSNYSPRFRRTIHGGFSTHTSIDDLSFVEKLPPEAAAAFVRWIDSNRKMQGHTEDALRAVIRGDGAAYKEALNRLHPDRGEKGELLSTVFLCKAVLAIRLAKHPPYPDVPEDLSRRLRGGGHPITLNWGSDFTERFNAPDAETLWRRFEPLDKLLQSQAEHFVPGFQSGPMRYHFNEMPGDYSTSDFIAGWAL
jgi:ectoine hydroxylase-related dioxygenase (phytanoyl-CoA dioxygenase family)